MKIGILIDTFNVGGVEKIAIEQVNALRLLGEDAKLVLLRKPKAVPKVFKDLLKNTPVVYLDQRFPKVFRFSFHFPVFHFFSLFHITYPLMLPLVVKTNEFDYFIVHGTYTCFSAISLKKTRKIMFSAFIWDPVSYILGRVYSGSFLKPIFWMLKKTAHALDKYLINNMDTVLVGGDAHNGFINSLNPDKEIIVIYPSVHPIEKPVKVKKDYVLMVTAWKRGKSPEYIFEIVKAMPELKIKMVGIWIDILYRQEFDKLLDESGFDKQIEIVGEVNETQLSEYFSEARVVLQTNDDRGFGMPALEAAGHGTTFIVPEGQGVCMLFTNNKDGYYTKEKDTKTIVALLKTLIDDKDMAKSMGDKAWRKVVKNYSWENHAIALSRIVEKNNINSA